MELNQNFSIFTVLINVYNKITTEQNKMAEIKRKDILKQGEEVISVKEYCEKYGNGLKEQALYYAIAKDLVDFVQFGGREKYIVMTAKTRSYSPNEHKNRTVSTPKKRSTLSLGSA